MKKKTARIICLAMAILMALMLALPYVARATAADDVQRLQQELDEVKKKGRELEEKEEQQKSYKANLQKQNDIIQKQIEALGVSIDQTKEALAQKQAELDQKRRDIAETDALFQERLRAMQVNRTSGLLSTLLAVNSFDELLTASTTLSRISAADTDLLKKLAAEKAEMERQEAEINAQLEQLQADLEAQNAKKQELAGNIKAVDASLTDLEAEQQANEADQARLTKEYNAARAAAQAEMGKPSDNPDFVGGSYAWPGARLLQYLLALWLAHPLRATGFPHRHRHLRRRPGDLRRGGDRQPAGHGADGGLRLARVRLLRHRGPRRQQQDPLRPHERHLCHAGAGGGPGRRGGRGGQHRQLHRPAPAL